MPLTILSDTDTPPDDSSVTLATFDNSVPSGGTMPVRSGVFMVWFQLEDHTNAGEELQVVIRRKSPEPGFPVDIRLATQIGDVNVPGIEVGPIVISEEEVDSAFPPNLNIYLIGATGATDITWTLIQVDAAS